MKVCIIGGGASGMLASLLIKQKGHEVVLVEKNEKLGKKIYITGKGRCNITNNNLDISHYHGKNPDFARISGTRSCRIGDSSLLNHNKLLYLCEGITGGKTGYTMAAGRCLVSACEREGLPLVCVTLSAPRDWEDHQGLYQWAYENYRRVDLSRELQTKIPVISGTAATVSLRAEEGYLLCKKGEELRAELYLPRFVFAPVQAGEEGGSYRLWLGEEQLGEGILRYCDTVNSIKD